MSGELEQIEWRDALSIGGASELNSHYVVEDHFVHREDWPKYRQFIMEKLDYELGKFVIDALKRGWKAVSFERWTWHDDEMRLRPKQLSATEFLIAVDAYLDRPPQVEMEPPPIPDWLKHEIYGYRMLLEGLYHIRTRIMVEKA